MSLRRTVLLFLAGSFPALAADIEGMMGTFLDHPDEAAFRRIEQAADAPESGLQGDRGRGLEVALFLGRLSKIHRWPVRSTGSVGKVAARIAADGRKIDAFLADEHRLAAGKIGLRWAEFYATGDTTYLDRIVPFAGRDLPKDDPLLRSVLGTTNASFKIASGRYPVVTEYVRRCAADPELAAKRPFFEECLIAGEPVTRVAYRRTGGEGGARAAEPAQVLYRSGRTLARTEEPPDAARGVDGLLVVNGRDAWMIDRRTRTGRHITDPGPTYEFLAPLIPGSEGGMRAPLRDFQIGYEMDFLAARGGWWSEEVFQGKTVPCRQAEVDGFRLRVFTDADKKTPLGVRIDRDGRLIGEFVYESYERNLPFDRTLFLPPPGTDLGEAPGKATPDRSGPEGG